MVGNFHKDIVLKARETKRGKTKTHPLFKDIFFIFQIFIDFYMLSIIIPIATCSAHCLNSFYGFRFIP